MTMTEGTGTGTGTGTKGYRGRFGMYLPVVARGAVVELTHDARNNSVRAL
jgi:hypothetical protein